MKLSLEEKILCAPNITEGRHKEVIEAVASSINAIDGVTLLDVDASPSMNRTVFNILGNGSAVLQAALSVARCVYQLVDMTCQSSKSIRPVLGALDACPFVPIKNATIEECVALAQMFAERLAEELEVPVYLYGAAAKPEKQKVLEEIRMEDYENLEEKLKTPEWAPDYGPAKFVPQWGATMVGARKFLINFNVNLLSTKEQATRIALNVREEGRGSDQPGRLKEVQAVGWYSEEHNLAQVSTSITDYEVTPLHTVYDVICEEARTLNLAVVGSQMVGVIPLSVLMATANHIINQENLFILDDDQKVRLVVQRLGLNAMGPFNPKERIIEYMLDEEDGSGADGPLVTLSMKEFILAVGSRTPTPGGTAVVTLHAALGSALASMTGLMSYGSKKFEEIDSEVRKLLPPLYRSTREFISHVDESAMMKFDHLRISSLTTEDEEEAKEKAGVLQKLLRRCVTSCMEVAEGVDSLWEPIKSLAAICSVEQSIDLKIGIRTLELSQISARDVVLDYLRSATDKDWEKKIAEDLDKMVARAQQLSKESIDVLSSRSS